MSCTGAETSGPRPGSVPVWVVPATAVLVAAFLVTLPRPLAAQAKPPAKKPASASGQTSSHGPAPVATPEVAVEEQKEAYLFSGIAKRQQGKYREAVDDLLIYVSGNDRDPDGHWELAVANALYHEARPTPSIRRKAVDSFRRCFELSPGVARTLPPAAQQKPGIVAMVAEARKAAGVASDAAAGRTIDAEGLLRLAESQADAGDLFEAKRNYDEVKALPPPPSPADRERVRGKLDKAFRDKIGLVQSLEATNLSQAQAEAGKLLRFFPDEPVALETYVRLQMRYTKAAMEGLIGQKIYQSYRNSIEGFALKGQYRDALQETNRLLFNFPRSEYGERKYEEILRKNEEAIKAADDAYRAGRLEEARRKFEDIRANYPDPGTAQDAISEIDEARRKLEGTLEKAQDRGDTALLYATAKELTAKFPSHQRGKEAVKAALADLAAKVKDGKAAVEAGRWFEAIGAFQKVLAIVPGQAEATEGLDRARAALREAKLRLWTRMETVPAGTFILGGGSYPEAKPKNKQASTPAFALDRYKVSNTDYRLFVLGTGAKPPEGWKGPDVDPQKGDLPVAGVSWTEADSFCRWLGKRLPSELEWEKAARGPGGLDLPYEDAPGRIRKQFNPFQEYPVNRWPELASPYKIEGMTGPVWEWTSSWFGPYPGNDDAGLRNVPRNTYKVARGGSKSPVGPPSEKPLEVTWRERRQVDRRDADVGLRCAASVATPPDWLASEPEPERLRPAEGAAPAEKPEPGKR